MWGRNLRGNHATCSALGWPSVTSSATNKQIGFFWCWYLGRWFSVHSRTLWVSPTNFPVRLGVSPAAATPTGFTVRGFEALFSHTGTLGCMVCVVPCSSQSICMQMWECLVHQPPSPSSPPATTLPSSLSSLAAHLVWMNISLTLSLLDFHTVRFSGNSGYF